jgi:FkbM family methyltransferase
VNTYQASRTQAASARELDQLLSEDIAACRARERMAFEYASAGSDGSIVLFGAGRLGHKTLAALRSVRHAPVAIADNNPALWGTAIDGVPILAPADAGARFGKNATFVVTIWRAGGTHRFEHSRQQLRELGCARVVSIAPLAWKYAQEMLPHYCLDLPHRVLEQRDDVRRCLSLLSDTRSQEEYLAQVRFRLLADFDGLPHPEAHPQYLASDLFEYYEERETIVDAGAYDGDTLREVIAQGHRFSYYLALEPDPVNLATLREFVSTLPMEFRDRVETLPLALFSRRARMHMEGAGTVSAALQPVVGSDVAGDVECVALDELLGGRSLSFLKLDIEGAEPDALAGARETISRNRPVIAVCVYHRQDHLWRLPLLIASLAADYRFYLRPYNEEGWDLVCYAVPAHRGRKTVVVIERERQYPTRPCPVCDAVTPALLFRQSFAAIDGASVIRGYDVVTCRGCGCAYADDLPPQATFDRYYRDSSKYEYHQRGGEESPHDRARMSVIAEVIAPLIPRVDAAILDIGCASGRLLYLLRERGFLDITGLDPSRGCVETAKRLYDVAVLQGSFADFPAVARSFDTVILVGVLEHIRDLDTAMQRVRSIVALGGIVYVEVPDALEFHRWSNAPYQDFSTEHLNFFSPLSLANLFARYGFEPVFSEQNAREQAHGTTMSNVSAAFRRTDRPPRSPIPDKESRAALEIYIAKCEAEERGLRERIDALVSSGRAIVVWGVGTHATRLLTTTRLSEANILAFVDSNQKYHGKELAGRRILAPEALSDRTEAILITSRVFQDEITRQIRETLDLDQEILTLYDSH